MPVVNELVTVLRYQADNAGLQAFNRGMAAIGARARAMGSTIRSVGTAFRTGVVQGIREGVTQHRAFVASQRAAIANTQKMAGGYNNIAGALNSVIAGFGALASARIADDWASVNSRVDLAVDPTEVKGALDEIYAIAQATGQQYLATGDLFGKLARNQKELGLATSDSLALTKVINETMVVGGGSQASQAAALQQLGQSLGSGVLRGDELNSIIEQAPRLAAAIAKSFNVPVGKLKELGEAGKLSSKVLAQGLLKQADEINAEFTRMPRTFGRAWTTIMNGYGRLINQWNRAGNVAERFNQVADLIVDNLEAIVKIGAFTALTAALTAMRPVALAAMAPFIRMAALLAGLYLIGEDISVWAQGGESIFGKVFGAFESWEGTITRVQTALQYLKELVGDNSETLTAFVMKWGSILVVGYSILRVVGMVGKGLALLLTPIGWIVRGVIFLASLLIGIVTWPALLIAAIVAAVAAIAYLIYKNWDEIKAYTLRIWDEVTEYFMAVWKAVTDWLGSIWDIVVDGFKNTWKSAIDTVSGWIKGLFGEWAVLDSKAAENMRDKEGAKRNPYAAVQEGMKKDYGPAVQVPQSYNQSQSNQVNNEIVINAQTSNPASLANAAAQAVGTATTRSLNRGSANWGTPNVEVAA